MRIDREVMAIYIADMSAELAKLATEHELLDLVEVLRMAELEARSFVVYGQMKAA